jgi:hypothetical protein
MNRGFDIPKSSPESVARASFDGVENGEEDISPIPCQRPWRRAGAAVRPRHSNARTLERFASPAKLCGYTGLCPRVIQSGGSDRRGPISKHGVKYVRWGLFEAALERQQAPALR